MYSHRLEACATGCYVAHMLELVVATSNPHKVDEIKAVLYGVGGLRVLSLDDVVREAAARGQKMDLREPEEVGTTFEENATIKALSYATQTGRLCLADDSGLEVDALGGRPGVISSHYCTDGREAGMSRGERDAKNNERVMRELEGVTAEKRTARFVCVMVVAGCTATARGTGFQPVRNTPIGPAPRDAINRLPRGSVEKRERNLPHWRRDGSTYFVTWRLGAGSLSATERDIVLDACLHWHGKRALVDVACVMPNHVHMLLTPLPSLDGGWHSLSSIVKSIKQFSATTINRSLGTSGTLWQDEFHDRIVRDEAEFKELWNYVWANPVSAKLAGEFDEYKWTKCPGETHRLEACATALFKSRGTFEGRIGLTTEVPRGAHGFGYDPLFLVAADGFKRTGAELSPEDKNRLSHRGMALREVAMWLEQLRG